MESIDNILPFLKTPIGAFLFIPLYAAWVSALLPGIWASMLAGALYGTWLGSCIVFIGATIGALISFLLGRTILREWAMNIIANKPRLLAIEKAINKEGIKLILLTRLSPVFPFSILNLTYGLSKVTIKEYLIGIIGILPGTILFCNLGSLAGSLHDFNDILKNNDSSETLILKVIGIFATITIILIISRTATKILQELESSK